MAITQFDTENADRDLTSQVTCLTDTPDASNATLCIGYIAFGDGTKDLDGTGGLFELTISVGGQTIEPDPQIIYFSTAVRTAIWTSPFLVPTNAEVLLKAKSPNGADTDVDVTAYLYEVGGASEIGAPVALDSGSATLSGMLTKMADDNGGADFNAGRESLNIIRTRGDVAWVTGVGVGASNVYTITSIARTVGDDDGGSDTDVDVVDGTYFSTGEVTSTTKLEVDATFTAADGGENPISVDVWGFYAGGGGHYLSIQAYNYTDSTFEEIGQLGNASVVSYHTFPLNAQHINTSTGAMAVKFLHSSHSGVITHVLSIDKIIVGTSEQSLDSANIDLILEDTNEMQGKLPDNYIMGSSDTEDHDDEIDAIVANLGQVHTVEDEAPGGGGRAPSTTSGIAEGC